MSRRKSDELHTKRSREEQGPPKDIIKEPLHYTSHKYQPFDIYRDWLLNPWVSNSIKYICRYRDKSDPALDLRKAAQYIREQVEDMKSDNVLTRICAKPMFKHDVRTVGVVELCEDWGLNEEMSEVLRLIYFGWFDNNIEYFKRASEALDKESTGWTL